MGSLDLSNHALLSASPEIETLCTPLHQLGINYFTSDRVDKQGYRAIYSNRADWIHYPILECTLKEIAHQLLLSPRTVEGHIENVRRKMHCSHKSQLIKRLLQTNLIRIRENTLMALPLPKGFLNPRHPWI